MNIRKGQTLEFTATNTAPEDIAWFKVTWSGKKGSTKSRPDTPVKDRGNLDLYCYRPGDDPETAAPFQKSETLSSFAEFIWFTVPADRPDLLGEWTITVANKSDFSIRITEVITEFA